MNMNRFALIISFLTVFLFCMGEGTEYRRLSPRLEKFVESDSPDDIVRVLMKFNDRPKADTLISGCGVHLVDSVGDVYFADVPCHELHALSSSPFIARIESESMPMLTKDVSASVIGYDRVHDISTNLSIPIKGNDIIVGVVDNGFDFTHPDFIDKDGNMRVKRYYQFTRDPFGQVTEKKYEEGEIAELQKSHYSYISYHGSHVAGIAAGSGDGEGQYRGVAPEAELCLVEYSARTSSLRNEESGGSAEAILAIKRCFDYADEVGKPCVVNFSSGVLPSVFDDRRLEREIIEALIGPGRILVSTAGNNGESPRYIEIGNNKESYCIINGAGTGQKIVLELLSDGDNSVMLNFSPDFNKESTGWSFTLDTHMIDQAGGLLELTSVWEGITLYLTAEKVLDYEGLFENGYRLTVEDKSTFGFFLNNSGRLKLYGEGKARVYAFSETASFKNDNNGIYCDAQYDENIFWPGALENVICVGAVSYRPEYTDIDGNLNVKGSFYTKEIGQHAVFSSIGPTTSGHIKPDVVAPGVNIASAYNSFLSQAYKDKSLILDQTMYNGSLYDWACISGTSQAAPFISGTIALMLQIKPNLTPYDIIDVFSRNCLRPTSQMDYPNSTYGYGIVDVYNTIQELKSAFVNPITTMEETKVTLTYANNSVRVYSNTNSGEPYAIDVFTMTGVKVLSTEALSDVAIDISDLEKGMYLFILKQEETIIDTLKVVKSC